MTLDNTFQWQWGNETYMKGLRMISEQMLQVEAIFKAPKTCSKDLITRTFNNELRDRPYQLEQKALHEYPEHRVLGLTETRSPVYKNN